MHLLIIPAELISEWISKGEIVKNYYNPEGLFKNIDFLLRKEDAVKLTDLELMCGSAQVRIFRYEFTWLDWFASLTKRTRTSKKFLSSLDSRVLLARYDCVRCFGADLNLILALFVARERHYRMPLAVSIHVNYDFAKNFYKNTVLTWFRHKVSEALRTRYLGEVDAIWPVYSTISPYLKNRGFFNYQIIYNSTSDVIERKTRWSSTGNLRIVTIGRLVREKNPMQIVEAVAKLNNVELHIYGDGPLRDEIASRIIELEIQNRVKIFPKVENRLLVQSLQNYDLACIYTEYFELSKVMIEAMLTGLPLLMNIHPNLENPELLGLPIYYVQGTAESYRHQIEALMQRREILRETGLVLSKYTQTFLSFQATQKSQRNAYLQLIEKSKD
jgi:glycosyltransferase involved in cell wall biosynthesis